MLSSSANEVSKKRAPYSSAFCIPSSNETALLQVFFCNFLFLEFEMLGFPILSSFSLFPQRATIQFGWILPWKEFIFLSTELNDFSTSYAIFHDYSVKNCPKEYLYFQINCNKYLQIISNY